MSSIRDYIIRERATIEDITPKADLGPDTTSFKIVLQNNTDFVINRKSAKIDKDLVFIVSQSQFYIKNNKNDKIEPLTGRKFKNFFDGKGLPIADLDQVKWVVNLKKSYYFIETIEEIITKKEISEFLKYEIPFSENYDLRRKAQDCSIDPKLYKLCYDKYLENNKQRNQHSNYFSDLFRMINEIKKSINYNNAMYFLDTFCESGVYFEINLRMGISDKSIFIKLIQDYNLDPNRFADYIFKDLYTQGIESISDSIIQIYSDYLSMQLSLYGKVKDKYPKSLKTSHDKLSLMVSLVERHRESLSLFGLNKKHMSLELEGDKYSIILPKESIEIVQEGIHLNHCSADYIKRVIKGDTLLLFLRLTESIEEPLITIEVKEGLVNQVSGHSNRNPTREEDGFIIEWAKLNNLEYTSKHND